MIAKCYEIDEALDIKTVASDVMVEACRSPDRTTWLDLYDFEPAELEEWLDTLAATDLTRRLCLEAQDQCGFYPLRHEILMVIPAFVEAAASPEVDYVTFVCRENLLLTLHAKPVLKVSQLDALQGSNAWLPGRSIAGLVSAILFDFAVDGKDRTTGLRASVVRLEQQMDREPEMIEPEEILDRRSDHLALSAIVAEQLLAVQALSATDKPFFRAAEAQEYLSCALANLRAADGSLTWLDQQITALRAGVQMHAQEKTNSRLGMLTILSAIFMPVTLLAGIWGMNFESMPELGIPYGYALALGFMVLVGTGMYLYFRKTGWFG
jgi:magnesium transporter